MRPQLITIQRLNTPALIEEASSLLYQVYIQQQEWAFGVDNPSKICIEIRSGRKLLIDRFTDTAIWFGAFDDNMLVGCVRLFSVDENNQFEIDAYPSSQPIHCHFPPNEKERCFDITKLATKSDYVGRGIVKRLLLTCFRFCQENSYSIFGITHNGYLKSLFKKIEFPMLEEQVFKYEPQDASAVNFYFADFKKSEVIETLKKLEYLENDLSNNARTIFKALQTVEPILPTPFYWMNTQGVVLGINELCLKAIGTTRQIIGKNPHEFYKKEIADHILKHNAEVVQKGEVLSQEEWIEDITTKEKKCFSSIKAPLYDDEGTIIGIIGTSIEITSQKEAESLKMKNEQLEFENKANKLVLEEQRKFEKAVKQMMHDITTPLASLNMLLGYCTDIPEKIRVLVKDSILSIDGITQNLLNQYTQHQGEQGFNALPTELPEPVLLSNALINILSEKQYQYRDKKVYFSYHFSPESYFSFIHIQATAFRRMMSNILNNAIDAIEGRQGTINVAMQVNNNVVQITIEDNGKGMSSELIHKINSHIAFTFGKENGHGIGMTQVRDTLENNQGRLHIHSVVNGGTQIVLTFPLIDMPEWISETIALNPTDIVVILDDDSGIHDAWDAHFEKTLSQHHGIQINHFTQAKDTLAYVQSLSDAERQRVLMLTDFELIKQELNGLEVISILQPIRAFLITSHHTDYLVQHQAVKQHTKIIPKKLINQIRFMTNKAGQ